MISLPNVCRAVITLSGILSNDSCITQKGIEQGRSWKQNESLWRIKYGRGSMTWGKLVFPPCPTFLLLWAGWPVRGGCESRCKRRVISTHAFISLFFFFLVSYTGACQRHAAPQQAGSDLCMQQPGERRRSMTRLVQALGTCAGGRIISLVS